MRKLTKKIAVLTMALCAFAATFGARAFGVSAEEEQTPLVVLMYHQLLHSRKSDYIVSPERFERDLILLKEKGYACVTTRQIVDYVLYEGDLPEKPVLITFDDGHYNNLYYGAKILKEQGFTALVSVIGRFCENATNLGTGGNPNYSYLTWDEVKLMAESELFEIGSHTYDMHNYQPRFGVKQKAGESDAEYVKALKNDIGKLRDKLDEKCGVQCSAFAYPFGAYNELTKKIFAEEGFELMLTCNEGVSALKRGERACLYRIKRYNRSPSFDLARILQ